MKILKKEIIFTLRDGVNVESFTKTFENYIFNKEFDIINNAYISETIIKQIDYPDPINEEETEKWLDKANLVLEEVNKEIIKISYDTAIKLAQYLSKGKDTESFIGILSDSEIKQTYQIIIEKRGKHLENILS